MPGDQPGGTGIQERIENLCGDRGAVDGEHAKEGGEERRIEGRIVHGAGHAGEVGMHVAVSGRQRGGESGIQSVVVEDSDERLIQRENADGQCGGRGSETGLYFAGKRQAWALPGTNRLYRRM